MRARPLDVELAHVRDVEDAAVAPDGAVLLDHALVLHRHLPAGEGNEARAGRDMALVERRALEGLHAADSNGAPDLSEPVAQGFSRSEGRYARRPGQGPGRRTGSPGLDRASEPRGHVRVITALSDS